MKKHVILLSLFLAVACNDSFLDRAPKDTLTDANFWQTEAHLRSVANSFSSSLKGKDWLNITEIMADNAPWSVTTAYRTIGGGNYSSDISQINSIWRACYTNIGRTNYFLNNYKRSSKVPLDILERYASEAYFYRAYNYWMLTSFFGDVPYITEELNIDSPDVFRKRDNKTVIVDAITKELEDHIQYLPEYVAAGSQDFGRISQTAAYALLSRIYLYNEQWSKAIKAAEKAMGSSYYRLYSTGNKESDYCNLFNYTGRASRNASNHEVLLAFIYNYELGESARTSHNLSRESWVPNDYARWVPTKSMVECYLKADGSIWNPSEATTYEEVFKFRDPRMKQSILAPGTPWEGGASGDMTSTDPSIFTYPKFDNTKDGCMTYTGYYLRKYVEPSTVKYVGHDDNDVIILRLGEVLLNYAEAKAMEKSITQEDIDKSINLLRDRVGMAHLQISNIPSGSSLIEEIRRERRVELFFEGHRFFDIIRWRQGHLLGNDLLGVNRKWIDQSRIKPSLSSLSWANVGGESYLLLEKGRRFDASKNYLFPVPFTQMQLNPNLKPQNPGWN